MQTNMQNTLPRPHILTFVFFLTSLALSGCATLEEAVNDVLGPSSSQTRGYPKVSNTVKQGCAAGAIAGVVYSRVKNKDKNKDPKDSTWVRAREQLKDDGVAALVGSAIGCTVGKALNNRRSNSASSAEFYDNEIKVTRNLNRELANVNSHMVLRTAENRKQFAGLKAQKQSATLTSESVKQARDTSRADLKWARNQLSIAEKNLEAQQQVASDKSLGKIDKVNAQRLNAELQSLETHVASLEREIVDLSQINDAIGQLQG